MTELRAEFNALKTTSGQQDPARIRYIESLLQRAEARGGRLAGILEQKASAAMQDFRQRLRQSPAQTSATTGNRSLRELNRLLDSLREEHDDPLVPPLEQTLRQQELDLVDAFSSQADQGYEDRSRHQELKAARRFHSAMVKLNADKVVTQALEEVPEAAGPLNPQRLATQSLAVMRDLSPHYLSRFVSYIDTLFWLEEAQRRHKR